MNNLSVGMQCLIIGTKHKSTEGNIGKVVTLAQFFPNNVNIQDHLYGSSLPCSEPWWVVEGDSLLRIEGLAVLSGHFSLILQKYLMPVDGYKVEEKEKQEEFV